MFTIYLTVTLLASALNGSAAVANLIGHEYPKKEADRNRIPRSWTRPLGLLLGAGALGLLAGFVVPVVGVLAAAGLVLYFLGALGAHVRAGNFRLGGWALFFGLALAALAVNLAHHAA
ncbi:DoxX family protein [Lentzea sp. BCCO 10_0856]|uniref:DoxX family protein n=1 Tax=Lentzea miocenica TaxID=3095431 RepID=A0ABU4TBU5_9PSEU|nr:DoxX family protein [Lentzea sp. BCCO 10_0856]MDX8035655.1 DoxX family protein [Lentzea sp. BCCO 10_0856]